MDPVLNPDFSINLFPDFDTPSPASQPVTPDAPPIMEQALNPNDASVVGVSANVPAFNPLALATNALAATAVVAPRNFATGLPDPALAKTAKAVPIAGKQFTILPSSMQQYAPLLLAVGALALIWAIADG